jgi:deoxyribodipyrimidine photolyase
MLLVDNKRIDWRIVATKHFVSIYQQMTFIIIIMDIQVDFFRWQVSDLKEYLQHRGITCHLYRKHELVKLCELAQELDLEKITSTCC